MSDYTPDTDEVRSGYQWDNEYRGPEFDRWLAAHDAEVAARTLDEAGEAFATGEWADAFLAGDVEDDVSAVRATDSWLADRAATIRKGAGL